MQEDNLNDGKYTPVKRTERMRRKFEEPEEARPPGRPKLIRESIMNAFGEIRGRID
jgi:hypothetical protein